MSDYTGHKVIAASVAAMFFSIGAVVLRIFARQYQAMRQYPEDYFIYIALVFKIAIDIAGFVLLRNGLGRHIDTVTPEQLTTFLKTQYTGSFLYAPCITFIKLSILSQYRRLFASHSKSFKWQINAIGIIVVLWCIGIIIASGLICQPISKLWTFTETGGKCFSLPKFYYGIQIPNLVTDILIIVVPIREMLSLDLSRKVKIGATAMFLLGLLTLLFGTVRLVALIELTNEGMDITYNEVYAAIWTTVEPAAAIVAVCIPSVRTLYRSSRARSSRLGYSNGGSHTQSEGKNPSMADKWTNRNRTETTSDSSENNRRLKGRSGDSARLGWGGVTAAAVGMVGRPDAMPHMDRRMSEESDAEMMEMGARPGTGGADTTTDSVGSAKPYSMASTVREPRQMQMAAYYERPQGGYSPRTDGHVVGMAR